MRHVLGGVYKSMGMPDPLRQTKALRDQFAAMQSIQKPSDRVEAYRATILPHFPPVMHRWFLAAFPDPSR